MAFEFDITTTLRGSKPRVSYESIARDILGADYSLSLVICGDTLARATNMKYRKKDYSPNVLSFPYSKNEGEVILNIRKAEREARALKVPPAARAAFLFIHGCLHLKGLDHSDKMDALEQKHLKHAGF